MWERSAVVRELESGDGKEGECVREKGSRVRRDRMREKE